MRRLTPRKESGREQGEELTRLCRTGLRSSRPALPDEDCRVGGLSDGRSPTRDLKDCGVIR